MKLNVFQGRSLKPSVTLFTPAIFMASIRSLAIYASRMLRERMQRLLGDQQFPTASFIAAEVDAEPDERLRALESAWKSRRRS